MGMGRGMSVESSQEGLQWVDRSYLNAFSMAMVQILGRRCRRTKSRSYNQTDAKSIVQMAV